MDKPVFPIHQIEQAIQLFVDEPPTPALLTSPGLTRRELFAAMAMQGLSANHEVQVALAQIDGNLEEWIAKASVQAADALIAELEKSDAD